MKKIGFIGYGQLGQFLVHNILEKHANEFEIVFIWNRYIFRKRQLPLKPLIRTISKAQEDDKVCHEWIVERLEDALEKKVDLAIEVSHPDIAAEWCPKFLAKGIDVFVGSPTMFANQTNETNIVEACKLKNKTCFIPAGALWGAIDIEKLNEIDFIEALTVTMKKEPKSLKVYGEVKEKCDAYINSENSDECILYQGPVRALCPLAPNNVNTMACACLAAQHLGFDRVTALLVADKKLNAHVIVIEVKGKNGFSCRTERYNPAQSGAVTGAATYLSFLSSLRRSFSSTPGLHFC